MKKQDWWKIVEDNWDNLLSIIESYHPASLYKSKFNNLKITAHNAELACESIRKEISKEEINPGKEASEAFRLKDNVKLSGLLSSAWFGIPESTSCWYIPGFGKLCDLLDDPINKE